MKITDRDLWNATLANNDNGDLHTYGGCVLWFAERWADRMEAEMANGTPLADCAERLESELLKEMGQFSLTGFQYGAAVSALAATWEHGDELRRWHNLKTQIGNEGERANEKGTVLNPALLNIG